MLELLVTAWFAALVVAATTFAAVVLVQGLVRGARAALAQRPSGVASGEAPRAVVAVLPHRAAA